LRLTHRIEDSAAIYLPSEKKEEMLGFFRKTKKQTKQ